MRQYVKMPSVTNVAAGASFSIHLPVGKSYDFVDLALTNITLAQLTNLELRLNGKTVQTFATGTELDAINKFHGRRAFANGILRLFFMRPELEALQIASGGKLIDQRFITSIGTSDLQTMSLHGDVDAACTNPAIVCYSQQGPAMPLGIFTKIKAFPRSFATSGAQEIDTLPRSGARIATLHLFKADISNVAVEVDSRKVIDGTKTCMEEQQTEFGKVGQTASATHVDFVVNGSLEDALPTVGVQDLRVQPTLDTSGDVRTVVEYIDGFEGI